MHLSGLVLVYFQEIASTFPCFMNYSIFFSSSRLALFSEKKPRIKIFQKTGVFSLLKRFNLHTKKRIGGGVRKLDIHTALLKSFHFISLFRKHGRICVIVINSAH